MGMVPNQAYAEATPENQAVRKSAGWYGRGQYSGRGGYIGKIAGGLIGGLAATAYATGASFATGGVYAGLAPSVVQGGTLIGAAAGSEIEDKLRSAISDVSKRKSL